METVTLYTPADACWIAEVEFSHNWGPHTGWVWRVSLSLFILSSVWCLGGCLAFALAKRSNIHRRLHVRSMLLISMSFIGVSLQLIRGPLAYVIGRFNFPCIFVFVANQLIFLFSAGPVLLKLMNYHAQCNYASAITHFGIESVPYQNSKINRLKVGAEGDVVIVLSEQDGLTLPQPSSSSSSYYSFRSSTSWLLPSSVVADVIPLWDAFKNRKKLHFRPTTTTTTSFSSSLANNIDVVSKVEHMVGVSSNDDEPRIVMDEKSHNNKRNVYAAHALVWYRFVASDTAFLVVFWLMSLPFALEITFRMILTPHLRNNCFGCSFVEFEHYFTLFETILVFFLGGYGLIHTYKFQDVYGIWSESLGCFFIGFSVVLTGFTLDVLLSDWQDLDPLRFEFGWLVTIGLSMMFTLQTWYQVLVSIKENRRRLNSYNRHGTIYDSEEEEETEHFSSLKMENDDENLKKNENGKSVGFNRKKTHVSSKGLTAEKKKSAVNTIIHRSVVDVDDFDYDYDDDIDDNQVAPRRRRRRPKSSSALGPSLRVILADPKMSSLFEQHCVSEFCPELYRFLEECELFKVSSTTDSSLMCADQAAWKRRAINMYDLFIKPGSVMNVNVSQEIRDDIRFKLESPNVDYGLFKPAKLEVEKLLNTGPFFRFKFTEAYESFARESGSIVPSELD